ncbi:hypothetical protein H632_c854p1 [Helicosporidium sp. ATCC 50920]|nr:hypothetical protein H632_c854p1 [Helicosporidium sp. ATCC 50920]|eukprot:KDD75129.1 hypothetical protein H632_c854p1 [Helicosporidium sp. ATCC 50920]
MGRHEDCHVPRPKNRTLDFLWLPYPNELAGEVENWVATLEEQEAADAAFFSRKAGAGEGKPPVANATALARVPPKGSLVMASTCLWHVLWTDNAANFGEVMGRFARALAAVQKKRPMDVLLLTCPTVWTDLINGPNSRRKQIKMVPPTLAAYDQVIRGLRMPVLDHAGITRRCGPVCTMDGVHSGAHLYEAEVQVALNYFEHWKMGLKP